MNRNGQTLYLSILVGVMLFVFGMLFLNYVHDTISITKVVGLDCTNPIISDGNKATCIGVDFVFPALIIAIVSLTASSILSRFLV